MKQKPSTKREIGTVDVGGFSGIGARMIRQGTGRGVAIVTIPTLSDQTLVEESRTFRETGGVSEENRAQGFRPAFLDQTTGRVWLSRFAHGGVAPLHVLDGLPDELVAARDSSGRVTIVKACVIAGFLRDRSFYTREQAARAVAVAGGCNLPRAQNRTGILVQGV